MTMYFMKMHHDPTVVYHESWGIVKPPDRKFIIVLIFNTYNYMVESLSFTKFIHAERVKI